MSLTLPRRAIVRTGENAFNVTEDLDTIKTRMRTVVAAAGSFHGFIELTCADHAGDRIVVRIDEISSIEERRD